MKSKTLVIPIRVVDYSNSSQVLTLFSREAGLIEAIAKGVYRPKNTFQGPFDLAVLREIVYIDRRSAGLAIVSESEVLDGFRGLRECSSRYGAASYLLEFLRAVAVSGEPAQALFDLSCETLHYLATQPREAISLGLLRFELRSLRVLGFLGPIDACSVCNRPWPGPARGAIFAPHEGGLLCRRCHRARRSTLRAASLSGDVVKTLQDFVGDRGWERGQRLEASDLLQGGACLDRRTTGRLHRLLFQTSRQFFERPLRSFEYSSSWL